MDGKCRLCGKEKQLCRSHFMAKAAYPTKNQKSATGIRGVAVPGPPAAHVKDYLLCRKCEDLFERNGEDEVLKWVAPKAKEFSLAQRLKLALPRERFPDVSRFAAYEIGLEPSQFAYFALSLVWRGAVHVWRLPDGTTSTLLDLRSHEESIRKFLLGEIGFPDHIASVIVIVCSDHESRGLWTIPDQIQEVGCDNYRFHLRGIFFRVLLSEHIPPSLQECSCITARQPIYYADGSRRAIQDLRHLLEAPVAW